jgi:hypothetical protein
MRHNVAKRMSWAARRTTTRVEDEAYCLLGLFDVNIPLLYGEGEKAFRRLQEAIMREEEDYTLLAWQLTKFSSGDGLLAPSPSYFSRLQISLGSTSQIACDWDKLSRIPLPLLTSSYTESMPLALTSRGLRVSLPVKVLDSMGQAVVACLSTFIHPDMGPHAFLLCVRLYARETRGQFVRGFEENFLVLPEQEEAAFQLKTIYVEQPAAFESGSSTNDERYLYDAPVLVLVQIATDPCLKNVEGLAAYGVSLEQLSLEGPGLEHLTRIQEIDSVGGSNGPNPVWSRMAMEQKLEDVVPQDIAFDGHSLSFLPKRLITKTLGEQREAFVVFAIGGHPESRFTVYLDLER